MLFGQSEGNLRLGTQANPPKRHRQTETVNRQRFSEIFAQGNVDCISSENGFSHQVFPLPLCEEELGDQEAFSPYLEKRIGRLSSDQNVSKLAL